MENQTDFWQNNTSKGTKGSVTGRTPQEIFRKLWKRERFRSDFPEESGRIVFFISIRRVL